MPQTILAIDLIALADGAARGLSQTLEPIEQAAQLRRTVNGTLVDVSNPAFRKYRSTIRGRDQLPPALDGVWPGLAVTVQCIAELAFLPASGIGSGSEGDMALRPVVAGSEREEGALVFYRPELSMLVRSVTQETDEWGAAVSWTIELEEV